MIKRLMIWLLALILLFGAAPVISVLIAATVANVQGCQLDEGNVHPCVVLGADLGGLLYGMGVLGWMALMTVPMAALALLAWLAAAIVLYLRGRKA
jgi:hypothetical protein